MPSLNSDLSNTPQYDQSDDTAVKVSVAVLITLITAVGYLLVLFISGMVGLIEQFASPVARIDFNPTVLASVAAPLYLFSYLTTPELSAGRRHEVALIGALIGTVVCAFTTVALAPSIDRTSATEFAAAAYLLFAACGFLPALAITRGYVFFDRDAQVAADGDHYVDVNQLDPDTKRLIAAHAPTLTAPPGWRPPALFGARDALTQNHLHRILSLEEDEARRLRDLHRERAAAADRARDDAHHALMVSLSPEDRALFEATLRADVEAVRGITAYKAECAAEIARLTEERDALLSSLTVSERTRTAQQYELDWLWGEWERHAPRPAPRERQSAAKRPPTVVPLHPRRSSWSAAAPPPYGGRA